MVEQATAPMSVTCEFQLWCGRKYLIAVAGSLLFFGISCFFIYMVKRLKYVWVGVPVDICEKRKDMVPSSSMWGYGGSTEFGCSTELTPLPAACLPTEWLRVEWLRE